MHNCSGLHLNRYGYVELKPFMFDPGRVVMQMRCIKILIYEAIAISLLLLTAAFTSTVHGRQLAFLVDRRLKGHRQQLQTDEITNFTTASCNEVFSVNPKARASSSCSLGATTQFVGPLQTWSDVKAMLKARSSKGEIILTHENRADAAAQWIWRMLRMGYAHTVVLTRGEHSCWQLTKLYGDELGCVWFAHSVSYIAANTAQEGSSSSSSSSSSLLQPQILPPQQVALFLEEPPYWRLQLIAMVVRLGDYNVLGLDTDVVLQDDFYWWMQQPDYRDYQLLVQRGGDLMPHQVADINLGVMYVRGASPSGPTAWALAEGLMRNIRWREQPRLPATLNCTFTTCWEQAVVTDSICSALAGRPVFWRCLERRPLDATWDIREDGRKRFLDANTQVIGPAISRRNFSMTRPGPACHLPLLGSGSVSDAGSSGGVLWGLEGRLRQPHFRGQWPEELGGRALGGESRGPVANAFLQMMGEAGPPLWPDPEDPSTQAAADSVVSERFAQLSNHLVCDWALCGSKGMFLTTMFLKDPTTTKRGQEEENEPCVVLGHLGMTPDKALGKRLQLMVNGHYNMDLEAAVHGPGGPYFATNGHLQGTAQHSSLIRAGVMRQHASRRGGHTIAAPRVVALAPGVLSPGPSDATAAAAVVSFGSSSSSGGGAATTPLVLRSKDHMISVMRAVSSVAVATGRTLALPRLSCDYPWMHRGGLSLDTMSTSTSAVSDTFAMTTTTTTTTTFQPFNGSHHIPWSYLAGEAFAPYGPSLDALSCEWLAWAQHGCLHGPVHMERRGHIHMNPHPAARMLLSYEMEHFLRQLPDEKRMPRAATAAAAANDGTGGGDGGNFLTVPPGTVAGPDGVFNVTMAWVSEQLSRVAAEEPVLWMEQPMQVVDLPEPLRATHHHWVNHCCGMSWPHSRNHICFGDF